MQIKEFNCHINKWASIQFMPSNRSHECSQPPKVMRSLVIERLDENIAVKGFYTEYFREFCSHNKCYMVGKKVPGQKYGL